MYTLDHPFPTRQHTHFDPQSVSYDSGLHSLQDQWVVPFMCSPYSGTQSDFCSNDSSDFQSFTTPSVFVDNTDSTSSTTDDHCGVLAYHENQMQCYPCATVNPEVVGGYDLESSFGHASLNAYTGLHSPSYSDVPGPSTVALDSGIQASVLGTFPPLAPTLCPPSPSHSSSTPSPLPSKGRKRSRGSGKAIRHKPHKAARRNPPPRSSQHPLELVLDILARAKSFNKCPLCNQHRRANRHADFERHISTHNAECNNVVCYGVPEVDANGSRTGRRILACEKTFTRRDALQRHIKLSEGRCAGDPAEIAVYCAALRANKK